MKDDPQCCCNREICTYDPDTGCGSRRMFGDSLGRKRAENAAPEASPLTPAYTETIEKTGPGQS